jgi:hypothetical protein
LQKQVNSPAKESVSIPDLHSVPVNQADYLSVETHEPLKSPEGLRPIHLPSRRSARVDGRVAGLPRGMGLFRRLLSFGDGRRRGLLVDVDVVLLDRVDRIRRGRHLLLLPSRRNRLLLVDGDVRIPRGSLLFPLRRIELALDLGVEFSRLGGWEVLGLCFRRGLLRRSL